MLDFNSGRIDVNIRKVCYKTESMILPHFTRKNRHSNSVVFYVKGGHRHDMENGERIISSDYDLLFLPYNSNYVNQVIDNRIEYYQIDFELYENGNMVSLFDTPRVIHTPESTAFLPHMVEIYNLYTGKPYGYKLSSLSHLLDIIASLAKEQDEDYEMAAARKRIRPTLEYISANYYNSCDVKELAAISGLSISGLEKNFIKATGMSPVVYRNTIRIEHAKTMLLSGFSISEVCEKVGFTDLYYFAKTFKRIAGITPGRFAKRERK